MPASISSHEESKRPASILTSVPSQVNLGELDSSWDRVARFSQVFVPQCGTNILYEFDVVTRISKCHEIAVSWAFQASFAFSQTPNGRLFVTGGIGDDNLMR